MARERMAMTTARRAVGVSVGAGQGVGVRENVGVCQGVGFDQGVGVVENFSVGVGTGVGQGEIVSVGVGRVERDRGVMVSVGVSTSDIANIDKNNGENNDKNNNGACHLRESSQDVPQEKVPPKNIPFGGNFIQNGDKLHYYSYHYSYQYDYSYQYEHYHL